MAVWQARRLGLENFFLLVSHVLVPPAMEAILGSPSNRVQGFLAAGHVCAVMGYHEYPPIAARYGVSDVLVAVARARPDEASGHDRLDVSASRFGTAAGDESIVAAIAPEASDDRNATAIAPLAAAAQGYPNRPVRLIIGYGAGGEARRPLGLVVVGGLLFSQLVTLYLTPVFYTYMAALQAWLNRKEKKTGAASEPVHA